MRPDVNLQTINEGYNRPLIQYTARMSDGGHYSWLVGDTAVLVHHINQDYEPISWLHLYESVQEYILDLNSEDTEILESQIGFQCISMSGTPYAMQMEDDEEGCRALLNLKTKSWSKRNANDVLAKGTPVVFLEKHYNINHYYYLFLRTIFTEDVWLKSEYAPESVNINC